MAACSSSQPASSPNSSAPTTGGQSTTAGSASTTEGASATTAASTVAGSSTTAQSAQSSWTTFGVANDRRGFVASGPDPSNLQQRWKTQLDGDLYGQPLVLGGHVFVATEADSVYALDAASGRQLWRVSLGDPVPRSALACGNIDPTGVTGTPVIDAATGLLYLVAFTQPGHHDLVALELATGKVRWRRPADPPDLDPLYEQQRSALTLANGRVYVLYGGLFGDCGPYKGAVVSYPLDGSGSPTSWVVPTRREGGLWAPSGAAVDAAGNLYVAVGNAASTDPGNFDDGNAVVRLTAGLQQADVWAPSDWYSLSAADADLGSLGPLLLEGGGVFVAGKNGTGYLLDSAHLGGIGGEASKDDVCEGGAFGGAATNGSMVVVGCSGGAAGVKVANGALSAAWHASSGRSGAPVIAGANAWLVSNGGHLVVLDVASGSVRADISLGQRAPGFPTPAVLPTAVYAPAGDRLYAYAAG